jgi:hypothetical protein
VPSARKTSPITTTLSPTTRTLKEWEELGETIIQTTSKRHIGGATKKKDQAGSTTKSTNSAEGRAIYLETYMAWGVHNRVVGRSRTEVHFKGSYDFQKKETHEYEEFTSPYSGLA